MKTLCIILLLAHLISCTDQIGNKPIFDPLELNYGVTEKGLIDNNYTRIPEDVPLFGKQIGDTLIYYQLDYECDSLTHECFNTNVSYRFCYIYINRADTLLLRNLFAEYDADIISSFHHQNEINIDEGESDSTYQVAPHDAWGFHGTFFVRHRFTKQIFECYIGQATGAINNKTDGFELSIVNEFPWNKKEIKERRWIYE